MNRNRLAVRPLLSLNALVPPAVRWFGQGGSCQTQPWGLFQKSLYGRNQDFGNVFFKSVSTVGYSTARAAYVHGSYILLDGVVASMPFCSLIFLLLSVFLFIRLRFP